MWGFCQLSFLSIVNKQNYFPKLKICFFSFLRKIKLNFSKMRRNNSSSIPSTESSSSNDFLSCTDQFSNGKLDAKEIIELEASKYFKVKTTRPMIKDRKSKVDNKTIKKLPVLEKDALGECLENGDGRRAEEMKTKHANDFNRWLLHLVEGANLLLCGYGSKFELIEEFRRRHLEVNDYTHIVLRGYRPDASVKQLLNELERNFKLDIPEKLKSGFGRLRLVQRAQRICSVMNIDPNVPDFIIIIHNIDGVSLRDEDSQMALSYLAQLKNCRILASIDHVNGSLLWDNSMKSRFQWFSIDATTYISYRTEILDGHGSRILGITKKVNADEYTHTLNGLKSIWSSVNNNARSVFIKLAKCQISARNGRVRVGDLMTFWDLFKSCRQDFIVSNENVLRQFLSEFEDHNLLKMKFNNEGQEVYELMIDKELLMEFLRSENIEIHDHLNQTENKENQVENGADENEDDEEDGKDSESESSENNETDQDDDDMSYELDQEVFAQAIKR